VAPFAQGDVGQVADPQWQVVAVADFDGKTYGDKILGIEQKTADLLWRHTVTGEVAMWFINGITQDPGPGPGHVASVANDWTVAGTGDFDGDGKFDILWRRNNGEVAIWLMDAKTIKVAHSFGIVETGWTIASTGDYNFDGKSDILWRHTDGSTALWLMNGFAFTPEFIATRSFADWVVQSLHAE
jgi:hypothetical protein